MQNHKIFLQKIYENNERNSGKQNGPQVTYYTNGVVEETVEFANGQPHGVWKCHDELGELIETRLYEYGKIVE